MATLGTYDEANLSAEDKKKIQAYKIAWADAKLKNDEAGMKSANTAAEAIRANYGYAGGAAGDQYTKIDKPVTQAPAPTVAVPDNTGVINSMYDNLNAAQTASLNAARDQANSDYQAQIEGAPQQFQPLRDQVDLGTVRNIQRANEVAAAKGTTFSGGVQSDAGATYAAGEGQKTALNQQEANVVAGLKKAIADNNRATSFKQIEMTAQTNAEKQKALMANNDTMFNRQYQMGRDAITDAYNMAGITGYYNGQRTLTGQQYDTSNQQWNDQFQFQKDQAKASMEQWQKSFDYQLGRDTKLDEQWEKSFLADQSNAAAGRAIQWAGVQLDRDKFEASKETMVTDAKLSDQGSEIYKNALNMVSATQSGNDRYGNAINVARYTPQQIFEFIDKSSLSDIEKNKILERIPGL